MSEFQWNIEFPEFLPEDMPTIPADWVDVSWRNDACPSFQPMEGIRVWVREYDPAKREIPEGKRFIVCQENEGDMLDLGMSDDWREIVEFVNKLKEGN